MNNKVGHQFVWVLMEYDINGELMNTVAVYTDYDHAREVQFEYEYLAKEDNRKAMYSVEKYYLNIKGEK